MRTGVNIRVYRYVCVCVEASGRASRAFSRAFKSSVIICKGQTSSHQTCVHRYNTMCVCVCMLCRLNRANKTNGPGRSVKTFFFFHLIFSFRFWVSNKYRCAVGRSSRVREWVYTLCQLDEDRERFVCCSYLQKRENEIPGRIPMAGTKREHCTHNVNYIPRYITTANTTANQMSTHVRRHSPGTCKHNTFFFFSFVWSYNTCTMCTTYLRMEVVYLISDVTEISGLLTCRFVKKRSIQRKIK